MTNLDGRLATVDTTERLRELTPGGSSADRQRRTTTEGLLSIEVVSAFAGDREMTAMETALVGRQEQERTGLFFVGVASADRDTTSPRSLLEMADRALRDAKSNGKNRVTRRWGDGSEDPRSATGSLRRRDDSRPVESPLVEDAGAPTVATKAEEPDVPSKPGASVGRLGRRIAVAVIGMTVLALGVVLIVLPGPASLVIPLGLAILATEFVWARKLQIPLRSYLRGLRVRARRILRRPGR